MKKKVLIIGGGFAGCASAHLFGKATQAFDVTLVEAAPVLGGGVRTQYYAGHPYTFGPRHFLTGKQWIFDYLNEIVPLRLCDEHEFVSYVKSDEQFYSYPIHEDDIQRMPEAQQIRSELEAARHQGVGEPANLEEYWLRSVGPTLYQKFINAYSKKMWLLDDNRLIDDFAWSPKGVAIKSGPRAAWDTAISAYPLAHDGYNKFFDSIPSNVELLLNCKADFVDPDNKRFGLNSEIRQFDIVVNTISPDIVFGERYGRLEFVGRDLDLLVIPQEFVLPGNVYFAYYTQDEPYTRITEYKKFTRYKSDTSLISVEKPSRNGRHYPMPFKSAYAVAEKYFDDMPDGFFSIGRAGSYLYRVDIDDCIEQAHDVFESCK